MGTNVHAPRMVTAWGETKHLGAWAQDPRCMVGYHSLYHRIVRAGWPAERAIATPAPYWRHLAGT